MGDAGNGDAMMPSDYAIVILLVMFALLVYAGWSIGRSMRKQKKPKEELPESTETDYYHVDFSKDITK